MTAKNVSISQCHVYDVCCRVLEMTQRIDLEETEEEESVDGLLYQVTFDLCCIKCNIFCLLKADGFSLVF